MPTTNLHPMIVHFPIALLLTGLLFAALSMFCSKCCCKKSTEGSNAACVVPSAHPTCIEKMSFWLLLMGTLGAVASVLSGFFFTVEMDSLFYATHHTFAISTMAVAIVATAITAYSTYKARGNQAVRWIAFLLYVGVGVMVALTGHYGGFLR